MNQNKSSDWVIAASLPVPLWNRNQGNIFAAKAQVGEAISQIGRVQNELVNRLAGAFANYAAARKRADNDHPEGRGVLPAISKGVPGGQFEYLRVLQAQRAVAEARLEYVLSLGEMWRTASDIAGLMLEDQWPLSSAVTSGGVPGKP